MIGNVGIGDIKPISKLSVGGKISITSESLTPDAPVDGKGYLYTKDDGKIYWRSYDIDETDLTGGGGGSGIVNNRIDGDLTIGEDDSDLLVVNSGSKFMNNLDINGKHKYNAGDVVRTFAGHSGNVLSVFVSGDFLFTAGDTTARMWNISTGLEVKTFAGHISLVTSVFVSGDYLFTGSYDDTAKMWDISTGAVV